MQIVQHWKETHSVMCQSNLAQPSLKSNMDINVTVARCTCKIIMYLEILCKSRTPHKTQVEEYPRNMNSMTVVIGSIINQFWSNQYCSITHSNLYWEEISLLISEMIEGVLMSCTTLWCMLKTLRNKMNHIQNGKHNFMHLTWL